MKKLIFFGLSIVALGCKTESDVAPATGSFMRYYGSEKSHEAVKALETSDGYVMLSNVEIPIENTTTTGFKIKLIKTDLHGNQLWEKSYPEFIEGNAALMSQNVFTASSFIELANSGYLIVGDRIKSNSTTDLLLLHVDQEGNMLDSTTISAPEMNLTGTANLSQTSLHGAGVLENSTGSSYTVLAHIGWPGGANESKDMVVVNVQASGYGIQWKREYGAGQGTLVNKILAAPGNNLFWAGSVLTYGQHDIRFIKAQEDSDLASIGSPLLTIEKEELAYDFCSVPGGYVITGSTNEGVDEDIFVMKVTSNAKLVFEKSFADTDLDFNLNDRGNSICLSADGALIVLATVESAETQEDLYLIKINPATGDVMWKNNFGGTDQEDGASVTTLSDKSFLVFGTSYFGRVKKLMLIKVKSDGQL